MRLAIVHLSDIHLRKENNPVCDRVSEIAACTRAAVPGMGACLIVVSGDIADKASEEQYAVAARFLTAIKDSLSKHGVPVDFALVPGNHDCLLPEEKETLREVLINGILPIIHDPKPDGTLLAELLEPQKNFFRFESSLMGPRESENRICGLRLLSYGGATVQVNTYNTALLSRKKEQQGQLHVPLAVMESRVSLDERAVLSLSICHHGYGWLESNLAEDVKAHIERTSDLVLLGHQHRVGDYHKLNANGQRVHYLEAGALQDEHMPQSSSFNVLAVDFDTRKRKTVAYRWRNNKGYGIVQESQWEDIDTNRSVRTVYEITPEFQSVLNDPGAIYSNDRKPDLKLRDLFVYPDVLVRPLAGNGSIREIKGDLILDYIAATPRVIFQGIPKSGKTALARTLYTAIHKGGRALPLFLNGREVKSCDEQAIIRCLGKAFERQYCRPTVDDYRLLDSSSRVLIIDDWHETELNESGQVDFLNIARQQFDSILLFTDDLFEIQSLAGRSEENATLLKFDHATLIEFGHKARGKLVDIWVRLGREKSAKSQELSREVEETERIITALVRKSTLPSLPFFVLSILHAKQEERAATPEAGSFGYLYEVLITTALNTSVSGKPQLDKKYTFLAYLAYGMHKAGMDSQGTVRVRQVAAEYSAKHMVSVDVEAMLRDLEAARVLVNIEGNYSFAYSHIRHYFIARYYREHLKRDESGSIREEIDNMVDCIASDDYAAILLFLFYLIRDDEATLDRLIVSADRVYAEYKPSDLHSDVDFLNYCCSEPKVEIPEKVDIQANREERREFRDRMERSLTARDEDGSYSSPYSDGMSDADKLKFASAYLELLGQVLRNSAGSLLGTDKLRIIRCAYLLGLRTLGAVLKMLETSAGHYRALIDKGLQQQEDPTFTHEQLRKMRSSADRMVMLVSRLASIGFLKKVSGTVGVADLERAYEAALEAVGETNATLLLDLAMKLDNFTEFPESDVKQLHKKLRGNAFASTILGDLVIMHFMMFERDRNLRKRVAAVFKFKANHPRLLESGGKK